MGSVPSGVVEFGWGVGKDDLATWQLEVKLCFQAEASQILTMNRASLIISSLNVQEAASGSTQ